jgi:hypothetical protein
MATKKIIQDIKERIERMGLTFVSDERLEKWSDGHLQEVKNELIKDGILSVSKYDGFDINLENVSKTAVQNHDDRQAAYRRSTVMMPGGGLRKMESSKGYTSGAGGSNSGYKPGASGSGMYEDAPF